MSDQSSDRSIELSSSTRRQRTPALDVSFSVSSKNSKKTIRLALSTSTVCTAGGLLLALALERLTLSLEQQRRKAASISPPARKRSSSKSSSIHNGLLYLVSSRSTLGSQEAGACITSRLQSGPERTTKSSTASRLGLTPAT